MKSENKFSVKGFLAVIGIIITGIGLGADSFLFTVAGVLFIFMCVAVGKNKNANRNNGDIVSGVNRTMPDNNTYIRSLDNNGSAQTSSGNRITYKEQSSNECPICKNVSANGYCTQCGYKFR